MVVELPWFKSLLLIEHRMCCDADACLVQVDEQGLNIHPHTSTVTYLTSVGAPTLVLDKRCPVEYDAVPEVFGAIPQAWLSYPLARKHMSFDARLLHGAPHVLGPLRDSEERVTFLANIWLNYHPSGLQVHDMRYIAWDTWHAQMAFTLRSKCL